MNVSVDPLTSSDALHFFQGAALIVWKFRDWPRCVVVDTTSDGGDSTFTRKPVCRSRISVS
jgi:hypothetical protein